MARFEVRRPITTREPVIAVDGGLPIGMHRFALVVVNAAGVRSAADEVVVEVRRAIVDPRIGPVAVDPRVPLVALPRISPVVASVPQRPRQPRPKG